MRLKEQPAVLDICCGFGAWSVGFHRVGFECTGIDVLDIAYPYRLVLADIRDWHPDRKYDVVVASPPCTEFSSLLRLAVARGQRGPGNLKLGMELVEACKRIIDEVRPKFWILENVRGAELLISELLGPPKMKRGPWYLWGEFPAFLLPESDAMKKCDSKINVKSKRYDHLNSVLAFNPMRSWFRAKIPLPLSIPLAEACMKGLEDSP
jgi:hypothetical protein